MHSQTSQIFSSIKVPAGILQQTQTSRTWFSRQNIRYLNVLYWSGGVGRNFCLSRVCGVVCVVGGRGWGGGGARRGGGRGGGWRVCGGAGGERGGRAVAGG